jgi:tetratricopeptide (TPR) repeat protein
VKILWLSVLLGALTVCALPGADTQAVQRKSTVSTPSADPNDPLERAYQKLLDEDDAAQAEADKWVKDAEAFRAKGAPFSNEALSARIEQRLTPVRKAYQDFLQQHPNHVRARLAYGSFLYETKDEDEGVWQWEKARELDPKNPAAWNNLANHYGHRGPVEKAFEYYGKAIELDPEEPVYLQNLATSIYLFRKDAMEFYKITEKEVFDRSLELYRKAVKLDPENFPLATDYAQTYYGIKPLRIQEALTAWKYALKIAHDDFEREGVYIHLARVEINSGLFGDARQHLNLVTNDFYKTLKSRLDRNLVEKQQRATNAPAQLESAVPPAAPAPR